MPDQNAKPLILLIEDDRALCAFARRRLEEEGFEVAVAATGQAAVNWIESHNPELILLDLMLPDMTGREVLQALSERDRKCPFIIMTGYGDERVAVDMMKQGAMDYLTKDVALPELLPSVVRNALERLAQQNRLAATEQALRQNQESERLFKERLTVLHQVTTELMEAPSFEELCHRAVQLGQKRLGFDRLGMWFFTPDRRHLDGSYGVDEHGQVCDERGLQVPLGKEHQAALSRPGGATPFRGAGKEDTLWTPIWDGKNYIGFASMDNRLSGRRVTEHDVELFGLFSTSLGHLCALKRTEVALKRSETLLSSTFNSLEDLLVVVDRDLRVILSNWKNAGQAADADRISGPSHFEYFRKRRHPCDDSQTKDVFLSGRPHTAEVSDPESGRTWETRAFPIFDDRQNVVLVVEHIRDITASKKAEAEIRKLNDELEQRVRERTGELLAVNKELEAFCYSVSHDLRAPLRAIDGFSRAVCDDYQEALPDQARSYLQRVCAASQRMARLIDDLLQLSRMTRMEMHPHRVDLTGMARTIEKELRSSQPQRQAEFDIAKDMVAWGDARLLQIAIENLLGNAWKFTGNRDVAKIEFGVERQDGGPVYVVRDNGAGFDMTYMDKLFGAFQRLHTAAEFPGTGIGLATVQRIIHRHGGQIWAEGHVGEGAAFFFTLPAADAATPR